MSYPALRSAIPSAVPTRPAPIIETERFLVECERPRDLGRVLFFVGIERDGGNAAWKIQTGIDDSGATLTFCQSHRNSVGFWLLLAYTAGEVGWVRELFQR